MKYKVYVVRDAAAEATMRPVFFERDAVAMRSFTLQVASGDDQMSNSPEDFTLYRVGSYDDDSMVLVSEDPHRLLNGLEAINNRRIDQEKIKELQADIQQIQTGEDLNA